MLKGGILHAQLLRVLGELGHKDKIVVCDTGLPIPEGVERVDLAWKPHEPAYLPVLEELLRHIVIEKIVLANEIKTVSPEMEQKILALLPDGVEIEYVDHVELKTQTKSSKAIIRTGEFTPYSNIILISGCAY